MSKSLIKTLKLEKFLNFLRNNLFCCKNCFKNNTSTTDNSTPSNVKYTYDNNGANLDDNDSDNNSMASNNKVEYRTKNKNQSSTTALASHSSGISLSNMTAFLKLTLVGDGGVGKSCLILQYMYNEFMEDYEPTKADAYRRTIQLQGDEVQIDILDTAGQEDYPAIRDGYLRHGDGFFLIFDLTNEETFESIKKHRENILRVKSEESGLPIILIGNKCDLRDLRQVSFDDATDLAKQFSIPYLETSALTRENVDKAFSEILIKIKQNKLKNTAKRISGNMVRQQTINNENGATNKNESTRVQMRNNSSVNSANTNASNSGTKNSNSNSAKKRMTRMFSNAKKCTIS